MLVVVCFQKRLTINWTKYELASPRHASSSQSRLPKKSLNSWLTVQHYIIKHCLYGKILFLRLNDKKKNSTRHERLYFTEKIVRVWVMIVILNIIPLRVISRKTWTNLKTKFRQSGKVIMEYNYRSTLANSYFFRSISYFGTEESNMSLGWESIFFGNVSTWKTFCKVWILKEWCPVKDPTRPVGKFTKLSVITHVVALTLSGVYTQIVGIRVFRL